MNFTELGMKSVVDNMSELETNKLLHMIIESYPDTTGLLIEKMMEEKP